MASGLHGFVPKSLSNKLFSTVVLSCLLSAAVVVGLSVFLALDFRKKQVVRQLETPLARAVQRIETLEERTRGDLNFLRQNSRILNVFPGIALAYENVETNNKGRLKQLYVDENPNPIGQKHLMDSAQDGTSYSNYHGQVQPMLRNYMASRGFYDIFLIDPAGNVVFSVVKEPDFATNLNDGAYAETGLGDAFRNALEISEGDVAFADFQAYAPSNGGAAAFVAAPIFKADFMGNQRLQGIVAAQLMPQTLEPVIATEAAESPRQTYLASALDGTLRTNVESLGSTNPLDYAVDLANIEAFSHSPEYGGIGVDGEPSFLAQAEVTFFGSQWLLISQYNWKQALVAQVRLAWEMAIFAAISMVVFGALAFVLGKRLAAPLVRVEKAIDDMAQGNLQAVVETDGLSGEIASIATSVEGFRKQLLQQEMDQKAAEQSRQDERALAQQQMLSKTKEIIDAVVRAANEGDFSVRCDTGHKEEALRLVAEGVNKLCETTEEFFNELEGAVANVSTGNLASRMRVDFDGRFGDVAHAYNETISVIERLVAEIRVTSAIMNDNILAVSSGAGSLAQRTESQAASLQEVSGTMDELTERISETSKDAVNSAQLVLETQKKATDGRSVAEDAVTAMAQIEKSSTKINDIISVIDSIAFQTNLLAVNAAVEAARAGDAGNGFAVVASEVRTLAQRSADAASDIKDLISSSSKKVDDGVKLVDSTGNALQEIIAAVDLISATIKSISDANTEQSNSVAEINATVSQLDGMTQDNAGMADSSAAAGQALTKISGQMTALVNSFAIDSAAEKTAMEKAEIEGASPSRPNENIQIEGEFPEGIPPLHSQFESDLDADTQDSETASFDAQSESNDEPFGNSDDEKSDQLSEQEADADWERLAKKRSEPTQDTVQFAQVSGEDWSNF